MADPREQAVAASDLPGWRVVEAGSIEWSPTATAMLRARPEPVDTTARLDPPGVVGHDGGGR